MSVENKIAPVLIPTLNRYEHFTRCISSLQKCKLADKTTLYIALDYPPEDKYYFGYNKIKSYLKYIDGFKEVIVIERHENYGVRDNLRFARNEIFKKFDRIIVSEDDNEFAKDFLVFLNNGLKLYENNSSVFSISGYNYPYDFNFIAEKVYFYDGFSAWGYATWKDKFDRVDWSIESLDGFLRCESTRSLIKNKSVLKALEKTSETKKILGDSFLIYHQVNNNLVSVFPVISKVRNHGHDGSGLNCGYSKEAYSIYSKQAISDGSENWDNNFPEKIVLNPNIKKYVDKKLYPNRFFYYLKRPQLLLMKIKKELF